MKRALCLVALLAPLALCLSTCIQPRPVPEALDPAVVEAEIVKAKGGDLAKVEPDKEPLIAVAEPPKEPAVPKPEPPKEPVAPKPEPPKEPVPPRPEPPKEPTPPKPEPPKEPIAPKPEPPKEPTPPKPEPPKEPVAPKPEPPKEPTPPKPEPPKEPAPPKPEPPKEPVAPKPEPPKEPVAPKPEPPKPEPPKEPVPPKPQRAAGPFLFSPGQRTCFAAGETAEYTVVLVSEADIPNAAVTLSVANEAGETWTTADSLGLLPAGRHSMTYGVDVSCFPEGAYKVSARFGEQAAPPMDLVVAAQAPRTHFPLVGWVGKAPKTDLDAQRWNRFLGLNTVLLEGRSPRGAESTLVMDDGFSATSRGMRGAPDARPMEVGLAIPPFVSVADRLTAAGLNWVDANVVSNEADSPLMPQRDLANPLTARGALHRIHQSLQAERRFRRFAGLLFTDEALLPRAHVGDATTPFGLAAHLAAYQKRAEAKEAVPWQKGSENWDQWYPYVLFRAGILGEALRYKFKPIIPVKTWREDAAEAVRLVFGRTNPDIVTLCCFMWMDIEDMVRRLGEDLLDPDFVKAARDAREETKGTRTQPFPIAQRAEIYDHYLSEIRRWNPDVPVSLSTENFEMWKLFGPKLGFTATNYVCGCGPESVPGARKLACHPFKVAVRNDEGIPGTY